MEKLQKISTVYKNSIAFYFSNNKLYIAINDDSDVFELPSAEFPLEEKQELTKVIGEMKVITDFIDSLKLSRN